MVVLALILRPQNRALATGPWPRPHAAAPHERPHARGAPACLNHARLERRPLTYTFSPPRPSWPRYLFSMRRYQEGDEVHLIHVIPRLQLAATYGAPPIDFLPYQVGCRSSGRASRQDRGPKQQRRHLSNPPRNASGCRLPVPLPPPVPFSHPSRIPPRTSS